MAKNNILLHNLLYGIIIVSLIYFIFFKIDYLVLNKYIINCYKSFNNYKEALSNQFKSNKNGNLYSSSVDLPLNNTYSCQNFCGPNSRCYLTGTQCMADNDCFGCQPYVPPLPKSKTECIPGNDDAGKLTTGLTPQYSSLTSGYGTNQLNIINSEHYYDIPPQANLGYNNYEVFFNEEQKLFNNRYKPNNLKYMPNYPPMYSITGEFIAEGPLPSNF